MTKLARIGGLLSQAKDIAREYYKETGKPLGITGEVAEYEAASKLALELCDARQAGYDAIRRKGKRTEKIQIKGRRVLNGSASKGRVASIAFKHKWDSVVLVLIDESHEPLKMYEATRADVYKALKKPGSKARNQRGALGVAAFEKISKLVWSSE